MAAREGAEHKTPVVKRVKRGTEVAKTKGAVRASQAEVEQGRRAAGKAKQAGTKTEKVSAKTKKGSRSRAKKEKLSPASLRKGGAEQRVSFVVRLTVDERGRPRRTEIEHAQSGKKEVFPVLDIQHLASFMQACITPISPKPTNTTSSTTIKAPIPIPETATLAVSLTIADVGVFRAGAPDVMALTLAPDEGFQIQIRFQLQGPDALSLAAQASFFKVKVYIKEVTSGASSLLATCTANPVKEVLEYTTQTQPLSLPSGFYRLTTLVTLEAPVKLAGFFEGPVVQVDGA